MAAVQMDDIEAKQAKAHLEILKAYLWYIIWPLLYLFKTVLYILSPLLIPIAFLLQPLVYLGHFMVACLYAPFQLLAKLETIYNFLGVAAIVGIAIGLLVGGLYGVLSGMFGLGSTTDSPSPQARTAKEYRQDKRKERSKAAEFEAPAMTSGSISPDAAPPSSRSPTYTSSMSDATLPKSRPGKGLLRTIIMEEVDSDY